MKQLLSAPLLLVMCLLGVTHRDFMDPSSSEYPIASTATLAGLQTTHALSILLLLVMRVVAELKTTQIRYCF